MEIITYLSTPVLFTWFFQNWFFSEKKSKPILKPDNINTNNDNSNNLIKKIIKNF